MDLNNGIGMPMAVSKYMFSDGVHGSLGDNQNWPVVGRVCILAKGMVMVVSFTFSFLLHKQEGRLQNCFV